MAAEEGTVTVSRLPIALEDYWTTNRLTRVSWKKDCLGGCGISLDVWQTCLDFEDGSWFAFEENDAATLTLASLREVPFDPSLRTSFRLSAEALEVGQISPLAARLGFWSLDGAVLKALGVVRARQLRIGGSVVALVHLHDDCFFAVQHRSKDMLDVGIRAILRVHEHYAGIDLTATAEAGLVARVRARLERAGTVELRTDPVERLVQLEHRTPREGRIARLLRRTRPVTETIPLG